MKRVSPEKIRLGDIFSSSEEVYSEGLIELLKKVLSKMSASMDIYEPGFGWITEGPTFSGEDAEVTQDGQIILNPRRILQYEEDVAMALIAHEFAHYHLEHYHEEAVDLTMEEEGDDLAREWGFNVDKFREVLGAPTMQKSS